MPALTKPNGTPITLLQLLATPRMDEMILWETGMTRPELIGAIKHLWSTSAITPEIENLSRSFQLQKHKPSK